MNTKNKIIKFFILGVLLGNLVFYNESGLPPLNLYEGKASLSALHALSPLSNTASQNIQALSFDHGICYTSNGSQEYAQAVIRMAKTYYPLLAGDFNVTDNPFMTIYLIDTEKELKEILHMSPLSPGSRNIENNANQVLEQTPMGAFYKGKIYLLKPTQWVQAANEAQIMDVFLREGPIIHEMVHFFMNYATNIPHTDWVNEGVALYYEHKYTGFPWRADLIDQSDLMPAKALEHFQSLEPILAYRKAYDVIDKYASEYGESGLQALLQNKQ